ncbi:MAG: DUF4062 domain-containing protein [Pseudomonadota bacterium]|uniref:DUF4062 domain-containing protein n=1 Tax=Gallaecimonas pentaromativorans TaxID=584787 RepID=UPI000AE59D1A|nr:DUF4062 domain-containing protein [Gallaecimonas pentaromativorans]MED5523827.1 DUF4062 domain-containing protein [Pseudomonadota bacterium]
MAKLRIFVSSTCYDLGVIRSELRPFIIALGHEPVMSDYADILYDPRSHTHDSCIKEVPNCDMVVLIIGSRFGGTGIPSVLENFDFDRLNNMSSKAALLEYKDKLSITQLEILKAAEQSIPVYAFVDDKVFHDHHVYEKNKGKPEVINAIEFPSIQKKDTAKYIFEFINFLTHRTHNNSITPFSRLDDIKENLIGQWSQLFQRLLSENRTKSIESRRYLDFSERLEDLKSVVMASIATPDLRDTARGAIQFRHMLTFLSALHAPNLKELLTSDFTWEELLSKFEITEIREVERDENRMRPELFLLRNDGTFYRSRYSPSVIEDIRIDWSNFTQIDKGSRTAIIDATLEDRDSRRHRPVFHVNKNFEEYFEEKYPQENLELDEGS